jgi:Beta-propeller repeat
LIFSTLLGGNGDDTATAIALDAFDDAYITGRTLSTNFPTSSAFQTSNGGPEGSSDAFIAELNSIGGVVYSSYLGGNGNENSFSGQVALGALGTVAVDSVSNAYVAGSTDSTTGFPTTQSAFENNNSGGLADAFVAKVAAAPADFVLSATPATASVTAGASATYSVTVSPVNSAFGNAVGLSCSGLPVYAACGFASSSMTPGGAPVSTTMTVLTGLVIAQRTPPTRLRYYAYLLPFTGIGVMGLAFCGRSGRRGKFPLALILCLLTLSAGCVVRNPPGGGFGNTVAHGSYNFTIVGTSGSITHSAKVAMIVQ